MSLNDPTEPPDDSDVPEDDWVCPDCGEYVEGCDCDSLDGAEYDDDLDEDDSDLNDPTY